VRLVKNGGFMRVIGLVLAFMLVASVGWAEVTGEIVGTALDDSGNIIVRTQYKTNGVEVASNYPKDGNGKYYWQTRYAVQNFAGMNDTQIADRVKQDISAFAQHLITSAYIKKANAELNLKSLVGQEVIETTATIQINENLTWEIVNGTKTDKVK
jgi:hypothetical protein